jgi:hypothetical protein
MVLNRLFFGIGQYINVLTKLPAATGKLPPTFTWSLVSLCVNLRGGRFPPFFQLSVGMQSQAKCECSYLSGIDRRKNRYWTVILSLRKLSLKTGLLVFKRNQVEFIERLILKITGGTNGNNCSFDGGRKYSSQAPGA